MLFRSPHVKWGRIDYINVTALTTKWGVWQYVFHVPRVSHGSYGVFCRAPKLIVLADRGKTLRFLSPNEVRLDVDAMRDWLKDKTYVDHQPWNTSFAPGGSKYASLSSFHARLEPDVILRTVNGCWTTWLSSSALPMAKRQRSPVFSSSSLLGSWDRSWYSSYTGVCQINRTPGRRNPCPSSLGSRSPLPHPLSPPLPLPIPLPLSLTTQPLLALRTRPPLRRPRRDAAKTDLLTLLNFSTSFMSTIRFDAVSLRLSSIGLLCMLSVSAELLY